MRLIATALMLALLLTACQSETTNETEMNEVATPAPDPTDTTPPLAAQHAHTVSAPGGERDDPWYWLRDDAREDPDVLAYLNAENAYTEQAMAPLRDFQDQLFAEMRGRIVEDDSSVPYLYRGYWYYTRYEEGREYPIHARRRGSLDADEEILLDVNALAAEHAFFQVGTWDVSPDQRQLLWLQDTVGRRQYELRLRDLDSGEVTDPGISGISSATWAGDGRTLFYVENHPETLRSYRVRRHLAGADADDVTVFQEDDEAFYTYVTRSNSDAYVMIYLRSTVASETHVLPADQPEGEFRVFFPRERDHEYQADHLGERWIVRTNWQAPNFRIVEVPLGQTTEREQWHDVIAHDEEVFIHDFAAFHDFLAIGERSESLRRIRIHPWSGGDEWFIESDESAYAAYIDVNPDQNSHRLRYHYTSMRTPSSVYEVDMSTGERELLKQQEVPGGFEPEHYVTRRVWATARDGERIPVSLLHHRDTPLDGSAPLYQYAYGSYGHSIDPAFSTVRFSLVDRGFVFAIAHIRGGQEMGRRWYDDGRLLNKMNTFTDFIDVTEHLLASGVADPDRVYAMGGSAGGLLVGAVINIAPERYHGVVAHVPFVDVVTTMLDESIPLTTNEYDEWGNPADPEYYRYMLSYSPYDNITAQDYPNLLITTGLWDSQVQYWEPAKWIARLRHLRTNDNRLLLHTNMEAGHGGRSGRFERMRETAMEYTFVLDLAGLAEHAKPPAQP